MARGIKSNVKFRSVDVLTFMEEVVQKHTQHYQSDFEIDKEMLRRAADKHERQDKTFIWLCRTYGTWCLLERNIFLKDTREYNTFTFYMEQTSEPILAFLIEITSDTGDSIIGNIYALDYVTYYNHVRAVSLNAESVLLQYEHGCRIKKAAEHVDGYPDIDYGNLVSIQYQPRSQDELTGLLWRERQDRVCYMESAANAYIARL